MADASTLKSGGAGKKTSLRDMAYQQIKQRIISLVYKPSEYLNEALLSDQIGIGKTPIHQAIDRLRLEGMVDVIPRKGVIVRPVSLNEIMQISDVRIVNEGLCAELAAERISDRELGELERVLDESLKGVEQHDVERMMMLDREFHALLSNASRNDVLSNVLTGLHDRSLRFWFISLSERPHLEMVLAEHRAIFEAVRAHDAAAAREAAVRHIRSFLENIFKSNVNAHGLRPQDES